MRTTRTLGGSARLNHAKVNDELAAMQKVVDGLKKLKAWFDKQEQRDRELIDLLTELHDNGATTKQLASVTGFSSRQITALLAEQSCSDEHSPSKEDTPHSETEAEETTQPSEDAQ